MKDTNSWATKVLAEHYKAEEPSGEGDVCNAIWSASGELVTAVFTDGGLIARGETKGEPAISMELSVIFSDLDQDEKGAEILINRVTSVVDLISAVTI